MFENSETRTELSSLGEFGLIDHLTKTNTINHKSTIKAIGDDAAVIDTGTENKFLISTDMLVEGVHFDLSYCPLKHLGYKSVVVNVSDIYAMNGTPKQITLSLAVSNRFSVEALEEFYTGVYLACKQYGIDLVGGDTSSSLSGMVISVTVLGEANEKDITYRNGAGINDLLVVTGDLGGAYMGLQLLEREKEVFLAAPTTQPELEGNDYLLERQLKPEARKDIPPLLKALDVKPTSMIDISDGLASEILHICRQSSKGCVLFEEHIPIDPLTYERAREFNMDPTIVALNGGEDYELLFTVPIANHDKIKGNPNLTVIGHITDIAAGSQIIMKNGTSLPIRAQGWNAFNNTTENC